MRIILYCNKNSFTQRIYVKEQNPDVDASGFVFIGLILSHFQDPQITASSKKDFLNLW
jgi:hypothetical protein